MSRKMRGIDLQPMALAEMGPLFLSHQSNRIPADRAPTDPRLTLD